MTDAPISLVHATAVAVSGRGVLILGASGAGKSDLALRLITTAMVDAGQPVKIELIADDQVIVERAGDRLFASAPETIAGQLEVRGLGIVRIPVLARAEVHLAVDLVPSERIERLPDAGRTHTILGLHIPLVAIDGEKPGAPARVMLAALERVIT